MSGEIDAASGYTAADVAKAAAVTAALALPLGCVYGAAEYYASYLLRWLVTVAAGMAVGHCGRAALRRLRIGGKAAAALVGAAGGLSALWAGWLAYLCAMFGLEFGVFADFANPPRLWGLIASLSEHPGWAAPTRPFPGAHGVNWMIEAALLVGVSAWGCRRFAGENKLCPGCGGWLRAAGECAFFAVPEDAAVLDGLGRGDLPLLESLPGLRYDEAAKAGKWIAAYRHACGRCRDANAYVTVMRTVLRSELNGTVTNVSTTLVRMAEVGPDLEAAVFRAAERGDDETEAME